MTIKVGIIQCAFSDDAKTNTNKITTYLEQAAQQGAQVMVLPELYLGHYFCKQQDEANFARAYEVKDHPWLKEIQGLAQKLRVVIPTSFFEKSGPHFYNSLAMINADGSILGVYRKSHIPDGPGYQEKYYFRPGNSGFMVFKTAYGAIGAGICWDQWFPEAARIMTLKGAELLVYPTAIGSEPQAPELCTKEPWVRVMKGHAVANMIPIAAANRVGHEDGQSFYGSSFICDELGEELVRMHDEERVCVVSIDTGRAQTRRASFGFFRDRRVDLYQELLV